MPEQDSESAKQPSPAPEPPPADKKWLVLEPVRTVARRTAQLARRKAER
ncbi:MAG: hypothetical protein FWF90_14775 [Promicromonosporaceae bacterium]|nr:hypothetical protein [Promicromonosporaceae bacterium]